jgi:hypothetical protein
MTVCIKCGAEHQARSNFCASCRGQSIEEKRRWILARRAAQCETASPLPPESSHEEYVQAANGLIDMIFDTLGVDVVIARLIERGLA